MPKMPFVENCAIYSDPNTCEYCKTAFYLDSSDGTCETRIAADIANCLYYNENGKCVGCATGFYPDATGDNCTAGPLVIADCANVS